MNLARIILLQNQTKADAAAKSAEAQVTLAQTAADTAKLYAEKAEAIKRQAEEAARKAGETLKEANELIKKAQEQVDARFAEMQKMLNQEKFKNSRVKLTAKGQAKKVKLSWKPIRGAGGYEVFKHALEEGRCQGRQQEL